MLRPVIRRLIRGWRLVARRGTSYPGATVVVVPVAGLARLGPPVAFVQHHQPLTLYFKVLVANAPGIELAFEFGVAAVRFPKFFLSPSKIHRSSGSPLQLIRKVRGFRNKEAPTKSATLYTIASVPDQATPAPVRGPNGREKHSVVFLSRAGAVFGFFIAALGLDVSAFVACRRGRARTLSDDHLSRSRI